MLAINVLMVLFYCEKNLLLPWPHTALFCNIGLNIMTKFAVTVDLSTTEWKYWRHICKCIYCRIFCPSLLQHRWFGDEACKNRSRNDLLCVRWDVKLFPLTHSRQTHEEKTKSQYQWHIDSEWVELNAPTRHNMGNLGGRGTEIKCKYHWWCSSCACCWNGFRNFSTKQQTKILVLWQFLSWPTASKMAHSRKSAENFNTSSRGWTVPSPKNVTYNYSNICNTVLQCESKNQSSVLLTH